MRILNEEHSTLVVELGPNNMATSRNIICPFKFDNSNNQNPTEFLANFNEYRAVMGWNTEQSRMAFKLALGGVAAVWLSSLESVIHIDDLERGFLARFVPINNSVACISELAKAEWSHNENLVAFLDRMKAIALRGGIYHDVLLAMAL